MAKLLSVGELLIDFTPAGATEEGSLLFSRNPGGAPANVAVQACRAGVSAGFLGCVGDDMFGRFLRDTLDECGVETRGLRLEPDFSTSLAFVQLNEKGDRDFSFYRNPGADTRLELSKIDMGLVDECDLLCFGSLLLTAEPSRSAVPALVDHARAKGKITAYDPNWRPPLWPSRQAGVEAMKSLLPKADIVKVSGEELQLLTKEEHRPTGAKALLSQGVSLVVVTLGPEGCQVFTESFSFQKPAFDVRVMDTTGSGDSFFGAFLAELIRSGKRPDELSQSELEEFADFANAAGSVCAGKAGAIPALPDREAIESCRRTVRKL